MAHSKVEVRIKCSDLPDLDVASKSDPQVFLIMGDLQTGKFNDDMIFAKTEIIWNSLEPEFVTPILLDYCFEINQQLRFIIVDVDNPNDPNWRKQDYIGRFDCSLGQIAGSVGQKLTGAIHNERKQIKKGTITLVLEELKEAKQNLLLQVSSCNIPVKKGFFSSKTPDTYFTISKARHDGMWMPVFKSPVMKGAANPNWKPVEISLQKICNGDPSREIRFELVSYKLNGDNTVLGSALASVNTLNDKFQEESIKGKDSLSLDLYGPGTNSPPKLLIHTLKFVPGDLTFLDYIRGGTQISLSVAIDFTQSNGNPNSPSSLHFKHNNGLPNAYQLAIRAVGDILAPYDHDQKFPVYGFGGKVHGNISHCFPLNGNFNDPEVTGVDGILKAYYNAFTPQGGVELWGPTNFSPVINKVASDTRGPNVNPSNYNILLIITDGAITDMDNTIQAIVEASYLPLSIIIVGVGNADFSLMNVLDGDVNPISYRGKQCERDIVQFVAMREFMNGGASNYLLPKAVLEEVPDQLRLYMRKRGITPVLPPTYAP